MRGEIKNEKLRNFKIRISIPRKNYINFQNYLLISLFDNGKFLIISNLNSFDVVVNSVSKIKSDQNVSIDLKNSIQRNSNTEI